MQHASLVAFLSGDLSPEALADEISDEVSAFYAELRATRSASIKISGGPDFILGRTGARRLLEAVVNQKFQFETAVYVADCIQASKAIWFADDVTRDAVFFVEDDSRVPSRQETLDAIALLD